MPLPKPFTTPGFTEASARAAIDVAERRVMALRRFIKRTVEWEIFTPVIEQAGLDPAKADCRLSWGMAEKPRVAVADVLRAFELGAIRAEELRKMLGKAGWELWEAEELSNHGSV